MAIIKGVRAADVSEVTPYQEDWDKVGAGIMAREDRANEVRNMINDNRAAMLKETRDNPEDFAKAQELEQGFKTDVDSMLNQAGQDYSQVSKSNIQRLAMDYAGKTDFRVLSEAKRNHDEAVKQRQDIESKGGTPLKFGPADPIVDPLFKEDNSPNTFTGQWSFEAAKDHTGAAKALYDEIGHYLTGSSTTKFLTDKGYANILNADGTETPAWIRYVRERGTTDRTNIPQVDAIIDGMIDGFKSGGKDGAGSQYYKLQYENALYGRNGVDKVLSKEDAAKYADEKVKALILSAGKSEYITEHTEKENIQPLDHGGGRPGSGNSGSGKSKGEGDEIDPIAARQPQSVDVAHDALNTGGLNASDYLESVRSDKSNLVSIAQLKNVDNVENNNIIKEFVGMVTNPNNPTKTGQTVATQTGTYQAWDNSISGRTPEQNRAYIAFKTPDENNKTLRNTTVANYKNLDLSKTTVDDLLDLGDDLFTTDDLLKANAGNSNLSKYEAEVFKKLSDKTTSNPALSTFNTESNDANLDIEISPVLKNMETYFQNQLNKAPAGSNEAMLWEAKLLKVRDKIVQAGDFMEFHKDKIDNLKTKHAMNYEHQTNVENTLINIAGNNGVDYKKMKDGNYFKNYEVKKKEARLEAAWDIDKDLYGFENIPGFMNIIEKSNPNNPDLINKVKTAYERWHNNIINNNYGQSDVDLLPEISKYNLGDAWGANITYGSTFGFDESKLVRDLLEYELKKEGINDPLKIKGGFDAFKASADSATGFLDYNPSTKKIEFNSTTRLALEDGYQNKLQNKYAKEDPNVFNYLKQVDELNKSVVRKGFTYVRGHDYESNKAMFENMQERLNLARGNESMKMRRVVWNNHTNENVPEELNKEDITDQIKKLHEASVAAGSNINITDFTKKFWDESWKGVRFDETNEGSLSVADYEFKDVNGLVVRLEHDFSPGVDEMIIGFGVPGIVLNYAEIARNGLRDSNGSHIDFPGFTGGKPMRLWQANDNSYAKSEGIKKGEFYILSEDGKPGNDPNEGAVGYGLGDGKKRIKFSSLNEFYNHMNNKNQKHVDAIQGLYSNLARLESGKYLPNVLFPKDDPMHIMSPENAKTAIKQLIADIAGGGGNFNSASSLNDYIATGSIIESKDKDGKPAYVIPGDKYKNMSVEDKKKVALAMNPNIPNKLVKDADGHDYPIDPETLTKVDPAKFKHVDLSGAKTRFDNKMADFVSELDLLISNLATGKYPVQANKANYNLLKPDEKIHITSGLRSIQDNLDAYNNQGKGNIAKLTNSDHMYGQAIDVRTEPGSPDYEGGKALWEFLKTPDGSAFLKRHGLSAYYHQVEGNKLHIDIAVREPAGRVWDDKLTYQTGK